MNTRILDESGWPCPTADEMRAIDRGTIEGGTPARVLMETAGRAVAFAIRERFPHARRPLVVCGGGNNGGDGYVVARVLHELDDRIEPRVLMLGTAERHTEEARANLALLDTCGVESAVFDAPKRLEEWLLASDLIVDALFGVGVSRPIEGVASGVLASLAQSRLPIVAVDLPSGACADTPEAFGPPLEPALLVTLGLPKLGLALEETPCPVVVADIGLSGVALARADVRQRMHTARSIAARLPPRQRAGHKGSFGHVLVSAGSRGKTGAALLAVQGALRSGAGLVTLAAPEGLRSSLEPRLTEAMNVALPSMDPARLDSGAIDALLAEIEARDVLVIGPGLGTADETIEAVEQVLQAASKPCVVDADALNAFAGRPEGLRAEASRVLTPHPGEMARLIGGSSADVQADRVGAARTLAERAEATVVLKGARTVIASATGEVYINPTGGPGLAAGGSGDVLAGVIGALLAQGGAPLDAAAGGVYLHGLAGEQAGDVGVLASEVAARIPQVWARLLQRLSEERLSEEGGEDERGGLRHFP